MTTEIIPLGTSSATPTRYRSLSATALLRAGRILLFDCGEGTQFRLMDADLNRMRIDAVFISHLHGDHFFGLPGLLTSLSLHHRSEALTIVGPEGLGAILEMIPGLGHHELSFPLHLVEFGAGLGRMWFRDG
jgi:ribonuclease Z